MYISILSVFSAPEKNCSYGFVLVKNKHKKGNYPIKQSIRHTFSIPCFFYFYSHSINYEIAHVALIITICVFHIPPTIIKILVPLSGSQYMNHFYIIIFLHINKERYSLNFRSFIIQITHHNHTLHKTHISPPNIFHSYPR